LSDWKNLNQSSNLNALHDEVFSNDEMMQSQAKVKYGPQRVVHNLAKPNRKFETPWDGFSY
jgi:hypothetical protein